MIHLARIVVFAGQQEDRDHGARQQAAQLLSEADGRGERDEQTGGPGG